MFDTIVSQLAVVAVFAQKFVDLIKPVYQKSEYQKHIDKGLALVVSVALCLGWQVDLLDVAGIVVYPWAGEVLTGIVAALGSNVLNDVLELLKILKGKEVPTFYDN